MLTLPAVTSVSSSMYTVHRASNLIYSIVEHTYIRLL